MLKLKPNLVNPFEEKCQPVTERPNSIENQSIPFLRFKVLSSVQFINAGHIMYAVHNAYHIYRIPRIKDAMENAK